jgi:hypothetical protein
LLSNWKLKIRNNKKGNIKKVLCLKRKLLE